MSELALLIKNCSGKPSKGGPRLDVLRLQAIKYGIKNADKLSREQICKIFKNLSISDSSDCTEIPAYRGKPHPPYRAKDCPGQTKKGGDDRLWHSVIIGNTFKWEPKAGATPKEVAPKYKKEAYKSPPIIDPKIIEKVPLGWRLIEIPISEVKADLKNMETHCEFLKLMSKSDIISPINRHKLARTASDTRDIVYKYGFNLKKYGLVKGLSPVAFKENCRIITDNLKKIITKKAYY